jgi:hypothetical protein
MPRICLNNVQHEVEFWTWLLRRSAEVERFEVFDPNWRPGPDPFGEARYAGTLIAHLKDGRGWFMASFPDADLFLDWMDRPRFANKPLTWYRLSGSVHDVIAAVAMFHDEDPHGHHPRHQH